MTGTIVIIDGNSLINRAYYAMQRPMITKEGIYTQGIYGFLNMLTKIRKDYEPEYMAVAFDLKEPTFRHKEYTEYKAGRKKMPVELAMQLPLLKDVLAAMNIKILELSGWEADDIIGTIARRAEDEGLEPLIITGDKDELQLATDVTRVLITRKGITDFDLFDKNAMIEKYGFTPTQFIDYKGLMGDQSDNIPGIPGVGEKTASKLLLQFGSVENMLAHTDEIANAKLRAKVEDNAQLALMSKRLATIDVNAPIEVDFEGFKEEEPDYEKLIALYVKLEFNSFLKKLEKKAPQDAKSSSSVDIPEYETLVVGSEEDLHKLAESLSLAKAGNLKVFSNNEHKDVPAIHGISITVNQTSYYINGNDTAKISAFADILVRQKPALTGHELIQSYYALMAAGYVDSACLEERAVAGDCDVSAGNKAAAIFDTAFDTAIAAYVLEPTRSGYDLKTLVFEYLGQEFQDEKSFLEDSGQLDFFADPAMRFAEYGAKMAAYISALRSVLSEKLGQNGLEKVFYEVELPLVEVLASMEKYGFAVDKNALSEIGGDISGRIEELTQDIYKHAGEEFNINSPAQLGVILFEKLGLPAGKKTQRGYSTSAEILEKLREKHPIVPLILEYRMLTKLKGTYIEGLMPLINKDGRIHAHFKQTVTATGRISCTEPNLQNIPVRQELSRSIRRAFVPREGYILVGADYSQIELRVLAHMSGEPLLVEAFNRGDDIHKITAARVFGVPEDEVSPLQRSNAKAVNFGVIYGMSGFGLSSELNITRRDAQAYIEEYFRKYAYVKSFMDMQVESCKSLGFVKTIMDRKRYIPEIKAANYQVRQLGERLAMNSPIQGSAADIIKIAMVNVYGRLLREKLKSRLILQVHDELIIETSEDEKERVQDLLVEEMENAMQLSVKLDVSLEVGQNWYALK